MKIIHYKCLVHEQRGRSCPAGLARPLGMDMCDRLLYAVVLQINQCCGAGVTQASDPLVAVCIHPCHVIHPKHHYFRETTSGLSE